MMHVGTKLHVAHAVARGEEPLLDRMLGAPKYVMSPEVCKLFASGREDVRRAVMSVLEAGIARLPYNPVMIEFQLDGSARYFTLLAETGVERHISAEVLWLTEDEEYERVIVVEKPIDVELDDAGFHVAYHTLEDPAPWAAAAGCCFAILMLNTRGIEKRVIETDRLNRARAKCGDGRPPIPHHTVVHIGTIYDRSGRAHSVNGTGRHMPVHLRSGFTRRQHFGKGNEEVKMVYIPPCIVNWREESGEKPRLPDKVVAI